MTATTAWKGTPARGGTPRKNPLRLAADPVPFVTSGPGWPSGLRTLNIPPHDGFLFTCCRPRWRWLKNAFRRQSATGT
jgi:hypothetical protein